MILKTQALSGISSTNFMYCIAVNYSTNNTKISPVENASSQIGKASLDIIVWYSHQIFRPGILELAKLNSLWLFCA